VAGLFFLDVMGGLKDFGRGRGDYEMYWIVICEWQGREECELRRSNCITTFLCKIVD